MILFSELPVALRQIMMIISFLCFAAVSASCVVFVKKRRFIYALICSFCFIIGYCCMQVMMAVARMFAMQITYEGFAKILSELPAWAVITAFSVFLIVSAAVTVPAVLLMKNDRSFPHFSKLKVQLHDTFGLSIVAIKAYYDGQDIDRETVKALFSKSRECFTGRDLSACRTYESIYEIGRLIGVSLNITGELPADESVKPVVCAVLSECMLNTFSHAWGDTVYVSVSGKSGTVVSVSNNGKIPKEEITEKGGLKHLRELIQGKGGSMTISSAPRFCLTFSLPGEETK